MRDSESTQPAEESEDRSRSSRLVLRGVLPGDTLSRPLGLPRVTLGRADDCGVRIEWPGVSRHHAEIYRQGPSFALRDLGSTNGVFVDGEPVEHCAVRPGMILRVGEWLGIVDQLEDDEQNARFGELAPGLWGGAALASALMPLRKVAKTDLPVVLSGETGVGKERFARALHDLSGCKGPLHSVNCAALAPALVEAELFGFQKGAFTGAERSHLGHLRAAEGGTLFLDEVAELPLSIQAKLLRALEQKEVTPLGDVRSVRFDARIVVAGQWPLEEFVECGALRRDLGARLKGLEVSVPPLRARRGDVPSLFWRLMEQSSGAPPPPVSVKAYEALCVYAWPENVRELQLTARRLLALHGSEPMLHRRHLPEAVQRSCSSAAASHCERRAPVENRAEHDQRQLAWALEQSGGNLKAAAKSIGISRQRAYRLLEPRVPTRVVSGQNGGGE
jgi:DNA-binding NtrC family response regulator